MTAKKLLLTHKNIRARYLVEKRSNPKFSLSKMADMFLVEKGQAYKWCRYDIDDMGREICDKRAPLPSGKRADAVLEWLNDGTLLKAMNNNQK